MGNRKRIFILDVDNTLINTEGIRSFLTTGSKDKVPFKNYLFPDSINFLKLLKKLGRVIIYSLGDNAYQPAKIRKSGIQKVVGKSNVIISDNKILLLDKLIKSLKGQGYKNMTIIDDRADVLEEAKRINPDIVTVWARYGKYKNIKPKSKDAITYKAKNLNDTYRFLTSFVSLLKSSLGQLIVRKELRDRQITDLIRYSSSDKLIKRFTHDPIRFANLAAYKKWQRRTEAVYSLGDKNNRLLGIIWFTRKKNKQVPDYPHSFAIRLYGKARGMRLSKKFMRICFDDFGNKKVWLETKSANTTAIKTYLGFGFRKAAISEESKIVMTY